MENVYHTVHDMGIIGTALDCPVKFLLFPLKLLLFSTMLWFGELLLLSDSELLFIEPVRCDWFLLPFHCCMLISEIFHHFLIFYVKNFLRFCSHFPIV